MDGIPEIDITITSYSIPKPLRYDMGMFRGTHHEYQPLSRRPVQLMLSCEVYRSMQGHFSKKFHFSRKVNGSNEVYFFKYQELFSNGFRFNMMLKNVGIVRVFDTYEVR